jgi:hypothetical protein
VKKAKKQEKPEEERLDFDRPNYVFIPPGRHEWRQRGPYLVCVSCELQHAVFIGMDLIMTGLDKEGQPILKKRKNLCKGT